jgi:phage tail-like protein
MRAGIAALASPHPLIGLLPSIFADDSFAVRWTEGFDQVLAPVIGTVDCLGAYVDPLLAPEDFTRWLAGWFGVLLDENWSMAAQRAVIAEAVALYRMRGTMAGLRRHLELVVDGEVRIKESGGVSWSVRPRPEPPTDVGHWVRVVVTPAPRSLTSKAAVEAVIRAAKPVGVLHSVEVSEP